MFLKMRGSQYRANWLIVRELLDADGLEYRELLERTCLTKKTLGKALKRLNPFLVKVNLKGKPPHRVKYFLKKQIKDEWLSGSLKSKEHLQLLQMCFKPSRGKLSFASLYNRLIEKPYMKFEQLKAKGLSNKEIWVKYPKLRHAVQLYELGVQLEKEIICPYCYLGLDEKKIGWVSKPYPIISFMHLNPGTGELSCPKCAHVSSYPAFETYRPSKEQPSPFKPPED